MTILLGSFTLIMLASLLDDKYSGGERVKNRKKKRNAKKKNTK